MTTNQPRVWLITGASSGFGRAIAECALAAGDIVLAAARRTDALADLVASAPERVTALALDVTDADRIRAAVAEVLDQHGRIDALVNNAGRGAIGDMSSMGGRFTFPGVGAYSATKFALEGWSEALAKEVERFGIRVLIVE